MRPLALIALTLALALAAGADKVVMKDGRTYEGVVLEENDKVVKLKTSRATLTLPRDQVASIEKTAGGTARVEREERMEALSPDKPVAYLELAEWLTGPGKDALEIETLKRLCNAASKLDRSLACRAQKVLAAAHDARGERAEACKAWLRAACADPEDAEAKEKAAAGKKEIDAATIADMKELLTAVDLVIAQKWKDAAIALRKTQSHLWADHVLDYTRMSIKELASDAQRRVVCDVCKGKGDEPCQKCGAKGLITCKTCEGKGRKSGVIGKGGKDPTFAEYVCRSCHGMGSTLCVECGAQRDVKIMSLDSKGQTVTQIHTEAGKERNALLKVVSLDTYKVLKSEAPLLNISPEAVSVGGLKLCATCHGVKYDPPATWPDYEGLKRYKAALEDRISGKTPIGEVLADGSYFDAVVIEQGCMRYSGGKWSE